MKRFFGTVVTLIVCLAGYSQDYTIDQDLIVHAKKFEGGKYESVRSNEDVHVLYWPLAPHLVSDAQLFIRKRGDFSVLIDNKLVGNFRDSIALRIDSLASIFHGTPWRVALYAPEQFSTREIAASLRVLQNTVGVEDEPDLKLRERHHFRDFVVTACLVLLILFVILSRLNPRLTTDYFSVVKLLSMRESEDNQLYTRVMGSMNIPFLVFISLLLALFLMLVLEPLQSQYFFLQRYLSIDSFWRALLQWAEISVLVLAVLLSKIILVYIIASLFAIPHFFGLHFFNWIRLLLVMVALFTFILVGYTINRGTSDSVLIFFYQSIGWVLGLWVLLLFLKLAGKVEFTMFHLFSYICATEIIPLLIIIKVLYN